MILATFQTPHSSFTQLQSHQDSTLEGSKHEDYDLLSNQGDWQWGNLYYRERGDYGIHLSLYMGVDSIGLVFSIHELLDSERQHAC